MGLFKTNICPKCGKEYSAIRSGCPQCGARKQTPSTRTAATTDSARLGTASSQRAAKNARWQLIFGLCLVLAVIVAVIVLIVTTVNGNYDTAPSSAPSAEAIPTPTPTPTPKQTPQPTPTVESVAITFLGEKKAEFSMGVGKTIQLDASIYPVEIEGPVEWSSSDENKITVSEDGLVTAVGSGSATIICRCYGASAECSVLVW